jgi:hypothetical protein
MVYSILEAMLLPFGPLRLSLQSLMIYVCLRKKVEKEKVFPLLYYSDNSGGLSNAKFAKGKF